MGRLTIFSNKGITKEKLLQKLNTALTMPRPMPQHLCSIAKTQAFPKLETV